MHLASRKTCRPSAFGYSHVKRGCILRYKYRPTIPPKVATCSAFFDHGEDSCKTLAKVDRKGSSFCHVKSRSYLVHRYLELMGADACGLRLAAARLFLIS